MEPRNSTGVARPMGPMPARLGNPHGNGRDMASMGGIGGGQQQQAAAHGSGAHSTGPPMEAGGPRGGSGAAGGGAGVGGVDGALKQLKQANEKAWGTLGSVSRSMENDAQALESYERALAHNPYSPSALAGLGGVHKARGDYRKVCALGVCVDRVWMQAGKLSTSAFLAVSFSKTIVDPLRTSSVADENNRSDARAHDLASKQRGSLHPTAIPGPGKRREGRRERSAAWRWHLTVCPSPFFVSP